jgi:hypothetical protein
LCAALWLAISPSFPLKLLLVDAMCQVWDRVPINDVPLVCVTLKSDRLWIYTYTYFYEHMPVHSTSMTTFEELSLKNWFNSFWDWRILSLMSRYRWNRRLPPRNIPFLQDTKMSNLRYHFPTNHPNTGYSAFNQHLIWQTTTTQSPSFIVISSALYACVHLDRNNRRYVMYVHG